MPPEAAPPVSSPAPVAPGDAAALWSAALAQGQERASLRHLLTQMRMESWEAGKVVLRCDERAIGLAQRSAATLTDLLTRTAGSPIEVDIRPGTVEPAASAQPAPPQASMAPPGAPGPIVREHPLVRRAVELFGARIIKVNPRRNPDRAE